MRTRKQKGRRARTRKQRGGEKGEIGETCTKGRVYGDTCKDGIGCLFLDFKGKGKCSPYKTDEYGTHILDMIRASNLRAVTHLIDLDPSLVNKRYADMNTPLMIAAGTDASSNIINYLIGKGANITDQNIKEETPLLIACKHGLINNVMALITPKKAFNLSGKELKVIRETLQVADKEYNTPLLIAVGQNNAQLITALLDAGADANKRNASGKTALMLASKIGNLESVTILLNKAPDTLDAQDIAGRTALMHAIEKPFIFNQLLTAGADTKIVTLGSKQRDPITKQFITAVGVTVRNLAASYPIILQLLDEPDASRREILMQSIKPTGRELFDRARTNASSFLGKGTFGAVRKVGDTAVKRVIFDRDKQGNGIMPGNKSNYNIEIGALMSLKGNPYVLQLIGSERYDKNAYMTTELLAGMDLEKAIENRLIRDSNIHTIVNQLLAGLDSIHAKNILHLDIKPANIWFTPGPPVQIKYFDFGLACSKIPCIKQGIAGSPAYMPELIETSEGVHYSKYNDYYALAITLLEIVDNLEFNQDNHRILHMISQELKNFNGPSLSEAPAGTVIRVLLDDYLKK